MAKKKYKKECKDRCCETCAKCIPIGEGDHICDEDATQLVLEDYSPTDGYMWCCGKSWKER